MKGKTLVLLITISTTIFLIGVWFFLDAFVERNNLERPDSIFNGLTHGDK